jgi:hypothetical protein
MTPQQSAWNTVFAFHYQRLWNDNEHSGHLSQKSSERLAIEAAELAFEASDVCAKMAHVRDEKSQAE